MSITVHKIIEANAYLDGNTQAGRVKEAKLPTIENDMQEHDALGMAFTVSLPGKFKDMEVEMTWNSVYPEAETKILRPYQSTPLQLRSNVRRYGAGGLIEEVPLVTFINVQFYSHELGSLNMKDALERPVKGKVMSLRQVLNGREVLFVDPWNNVYSVDGVDYQAQMRANIGA